MINDIIGYIVRLVSAILVALAVAFGVYRAGKKDAKNEKEIEDLQSENKILKSTLKLKKNEIKNADIARDYINDQLRKRGIDKEY